MRKWTGLLFLFLIVASTLLWAGGEEKDWQSAQKQDTVHAYDQYLQDHPRGAHADLALESAILRGREEIKDPGRGCDSGFPRVLYYSVAASQDAAVPGKALAAALAQKGECDFSTSLNEQDIVRAVEGLLLARKRMEPLAGSQLPVRAMIDLDFILINLQEEVIKNAYDEIVKCSDQSAWVDTPKKKAWACSRPYREVQMRMAQAIADQIKYDFDYIGQVNDQDYRMKFWERHRRLCKHLMMEEIGPAFQLHKHADQARQKESSAKVADKIETVAIRLSGGGKPRGAALSF